MQRSLLPDRPLALVPGRQVGGLVAILLMLACTFAAAYVAVDSLLDLRRYAREQAIWDRGIPAAEVMVTGRARNKLVFKTFDLDVGYRDRGGVFHAPHLTFATLAGDGGVDTDGQAAVRYDPIDPTQYAVSWALQARDGRWRNSVIGGPIFVVLALLGLWTTRAIARAIGRQRRIGHTGDEVAVTVDRITRRTLKGKPSDLYEVHWHLGDAAPLSTVLDARKGTVAWLGTDRRALALVNADRTYGLLLRSDLHPFVLTADERAAVLAKLAADGGGAARGPLATLDSPP